jgi:hypothetical protein
LLDAGCGPGRLATGLLCWLRSGRLVADIIAREGVLNVPKTFGYFVADL